MTGTDGGGLTVEFYKSTATLARDAFGLGRVDHWNGSLRRRWEDLQQGLEPSQGRFVMTHWSQACFDVVARVAEVEPFRLLFGTLEGFSAEWHLFTCLESRSLLANWSPQCWHL